ncbi:MAG: putative ABC transporter permease [Bacilli bacterium]
MLYTICYYFILFISYSFLGWLWEVLCCSSIQGKLVINRGFLVGPYCPIYGCGAILGIFFLTRYITDPITVFILAVVGASVLEYVTSLLMEKLFNARWWDYSNKKFNLNGRTCLGISICFGLVGLLLLYVINPIYTELLNKIPENILIILSSILFILFLADTITSFVIISKLKIKTKILHDSSEEINEQVRIELNKNKIFTRRLLNAFPKVKTNYGDAIIDKIRKVLESATKKIKNK